MSWIQLIGRMTRTTYTILTIVISTIQCGDAAQSKVISSPLFGSAELGHWFDDGMATVSPPAIRLGSLNISWGAFIFGLQASYILENGGMVSGALHGTVPYVEESNEIHFQENEKIFRVTGAVEQTYGYITKLKLYTRNSEELIKVYGPFGNGTGFDSPFSLTGKVVGLFGRSGQYLNALGAYTMPIPAPYYNKTEIIGGIFGEPFDDYPILLSGQPRLLNMTVNSGGYIYGLGTTYMLQNRTLYGAFHGESGSSNKVISFHDTEKIVRIDVAIASLFVNYLMFSTLDSRGTERIYGPYGDTPQTDISTIHGTVYGLFGKTGQDHITAVTGLGFYL